MTPDASPPEPGFADQLRRDLPSGDAHHVLRLFERDLATLSAAIAEAAQARQAERLRRAAHALAGAAGAVGAADLGAACRAAMTDPSDAPDRLLAHGRAVGAAATTAAAALRRVTAELAVG